MPVVSVRVTEEEKGFLDFMSEFLGKSVSEILKTYSFEELEDMYDIKIADERTIQNKGERTFTSNEVREILGLSNV